MINGRKPTCKTIIKYTDMSVRISCVGYDLQFIISLEAKRSLLSFFSSVLVMIMYERRVGPFLISNF